jgi:3-deoxy-D-manno-octulosonate 8-phosphate phosphatase (KDO 8-P phosphatase)
MPVREVLERYTRDQIKKAGQIKAIFFDVDGVLTDGKITYDESGKEFKSFHGRDERIMLYLKKAGIIVGIISGRESPIVSKRAAELKLDFCHQGIIDKLATFEKLVSFHKLKKKQVAYIGDDIDDVGVLKVTGLAACPSDAPEYIRDKVELVTRAKGGQGVVREIADLVLAAQGGLDKVLREA